MHPQTEINETKRQSPTIHAAAQTGQAIVLVAITMVILLASIGLAIDGGNLFLAYRNVQGAVDSAALTAAFTACTDGDAVTAAERVLLVNGVDDTLGGVVTEVNRPPVRNTTYTGDQYIEVYAEVTNPSYFIQIVYPGPLRVSAEAISVCRGGSGTTVTDDVVTRYAFRSLAGPGECGTPAWNVAGTRFTVIGDIWMPNAQGNVEFNSPNDDDGAIDHTTFNNATDVLGNIYIGEGSGVSPNDQHGSPNLNAQSNALVEDVVGSGAEDDIPAAWRGYGGDGTIEYNAPEPGDLPWDFTYFEPGGGLQATIGTSYIDLTDPLVTGGINYCDHGEINHQDFSRPEFTWFDDATDTFQPGVYYMGTCTVTFNNMTATGAGGTNVSFISSGRFNLNSGPYTFSNYGDVPLFVTDFGTGGTDCSQVGGPSNAIYFNAGGSTLEGAIIAFRGSVEFAGNGYRFDSCISARGFYGNGNDDSIYRCLPGTPVDGIEEYGLVE